MADSNKKPPVPIPILITIALTLTVSVAVAAAASSGVFNSLLNPNSNVPLINGTIVNNDNKTYHILITSTNQTITPTPVPPPPVINDTVPPIVCVNGTHLVNGTCIPDVIIPPVINDTIPPVVNGSKPIKIIEVGDVSDSTAGKVIGLFHTNFLGRHLNKISDCNFDVCSFP